MSHKFEDEKPSRAVGLRSEAARCQFTEKWMVWDIQAGLGEADCGEFANEVEVEAVYKRYGA